MEGSEEGLYEGLPLVSIKRLMMRPPNLERCKSEVMVMVVVVMGDGRGGGGGSTDE